MAAHDGNDDNLKDFLPLKDDNLKDLLPPKDDNLKDYPPNTELSSSKVSALEKENTKEELSEVDSKVTSIINKSVLGVVRERVEAITSVSVGVLMPEDVINKIKKNKKRGTKFDASQIVRLQDGPKVLTAALHAELGFTPEKLRRIAENLDPRIVLNVEGEIFFDKKLLAESFEAYLQSQQDNNLLQMSRSSRAALRRNILLRESATFLEESLRKSPKSREELTTRVNTAFGKLYKPIKSNDILAFLESFRINEEKRRLREQEAELERLALDQLERLEATNQL